MHYIIDIVRLVAHETLSREYGATI